MASLASAASAANTTLRCITLVLGGARAGKSAYAERLIAEELAPQQTALYIATAEARDAEMAERIAQHRAQRGAIWETREVPLALPDALRSISRSDQPVLVDCLTLWMSNVLASEQDVGAATRDLIAALKEARGPVALVSNEVGLGIVPDNALARAFRDHVGRLHQAIAEIADRVVFVAAGLPLVLKEKK
ncbi:MAG TPA: bifunctional adenosylcobinamide kinase/adenosylcobinamide-phosphate guanylyltransferase [Alphaproteobacteria bacterium]|nr:bifunctional adenosylcobinamide kinase/adenosylcobinamide-phosphate guanylyltransferase [Alphaproteobacteria bacterium]